MIGKTNIPMGMSKGETVSILLKTNQSSNEDLNGVKVVVSYDDESHEYAYNGQFSVEIPDGKVYTVSFGEVNGYKTPSSVTYTSVKGFSRSVEVTYSSEFLTLNVTGTSTPVITIKKVKEVGVSEKYKVVDYVETNGTQYINTGFKPNQDTKVVVDVVFPTKPTNHSALFGSREANNKQFWTYYRYSDNAYSIRYNTVSDKKLSYDATQRALITMDKNVLHVNDVSVSSTAGTFSADYPLAIFATNNAGTIQYYSSCKLYSCQIYDNGILVRDYIPALRSDGVAGLYDAVNDTFSSSTGSLVGGGYISDETIATQTSVSGLHKIAYDTEYIIEASAVDGLITPELQYYTASQPTREISMEYKKAVEHVIVNVVDETDAFVNGQTLTVSGGVSESYIIMNNKVEFDVPEGLTYTVSVDDKDGYITPESQTFTACTETREINMVYKELKHGVFIQGVSGKLYETDVWTSQETPNGVAVITEECSFVIALTEASSTMQINDSYSEALEKYMTAITDVTQAAADYNGAENTTNIMQLQSRTKYAAGWCDAFSFPSGLTGFLPSCGQMCAAYDNKSAVNAALTKAGGTAFTSVDYWTSTFGGVYGTYRRCWVLSWQNYSVYRSHLSDTNRVRAFSNL